VRAREAGERRAQEAVEVVPPPALPLEAQEREQRLPEGRLADPDPPLDRVGHPERGEGGLELGPLPLDARADDEDLLGPGAGPDQAQRLVGDELERAARAGPFEEPNRPVQLWGGRRPVGEQVALEMRERRRSELAVARRELLDAAGRERAQVGGRARKRFERRPVRLVRKRDGDLGPAGERFEQAPLRSGEVLEAVREHGAVRPGVELAGHELGRVPSPQVPVPEPEPVQLGAIRGIEQGEVAAQLVRLDEARLELGERGAERVREAGEARRGAEPVQGRGGDGCADDQLALRVGRHRTSGAARARDPLEEVVEGADLAREQRAAAVQELTLDALDVRPVRHDQDRIPAERAQVALEKRGDLARVRGP
jgi:hypothetical protein